MQQRQRPERHHQNLGPEIRRADGENRDTGHQQYGEHGVTFADCLASKLEHRPIGHQDAKLRQQIDACEMSARGAQGEFGEPIGERRRVACSQRHIASDRDHVRHIAGRRGIEDRGHHEPQKRLGQRGEPEHEAWPGAQDFDQQGYGEHAGRFCGTGGRHKPEGAREATRERNRRSAAASCARPATATGEKLCRWWMVGPSRFSASKCSGTE